MRRLRPFVDSIGVVVAGVDSVVVVVE
jgi:hypothetical protein